MQDWLTRREFLHRTGLGLGGLVAAGCTTRQERAEAAASEHGAESATATSRAHATAADPTAHIAVQLYTVRRLAERDLDGTLRALAGIGYREVEFAGYHGHAPAAVRAMLDRAGLTAPGAHVSLDALRGDLPSVLDAAATIGHRYVICPWLDAPRTLDAWRRLGEEFNRFGERCRERGLVFAYHNHDFEFAPIGDTMPYDVLLAATDPSLVRLELDLFWTVKGGQDPVAYFERHPGRFPLVHVKDMRDPRGAQVMTDVGTGDIDFRRIFAHAARAGIVHYVAEHDEPPDALASARTSYQNLRRILA